MTMTMTAEDIIMKLRIKLSNFDCKYATKPQTIVLSSQWRHEHNIICEKISQLFPFYPAIQYIYSNAMSQIDVKVY